MFFFDNSWRLPLLYTKRKNKKKNKKTKKLIGIDISLQYTPSLLCVMGKISFRNHSFLVNDRVIVFPFHSALPCSSVRWCMISLIPKHKVLSVPIWYLHVFGRACIFRHSCTNQTWSRHETITVSNLHLCRPHEHDTCANQFFYVPES